MSHISNNEDINKLINYFEGTIDIKNPCGMNKIKKLIKDDPSSSDLGVLRNYLYGKLLETGKNIKSLEREVLNDTYKKQEKVLNVYRSILNCNFDFAVTYWSSLLGLTPEYNSIYDGFKNFGLYSDLNNKNEFYQELSKFIKSEKFDENVFNCLKRNTSKYPDEQHIRINYSKQKHNVDNCTKELGIYGELISYRFSKQELINQGKEELSDRVIWVARDIGDFFGFDQTSFDENEEEMLLEVKATDSINFEKEKDNFYVTQNEFQNMKKLKDEYQYYIVRVYIDSDGVGHLYYLKPNKDMSVEYGDIKYVTDGKLGKNKNTYEYKRKPKRKIYKLD